VAQSTINDFVSGHWVWAPAISLPISEYIKALKVAGMVPQWQNEKLLNQKSTCNIQFNSKTGKNTAFRAAERRAKFLEDQLVFYDDMYSTDELYELSTELLALRIDMLRLGGKIVEASSSQPIWQPSLRFSIPPAFPRSSTRSYSTEVSPASFVTQATSTFSEYDVVRQSIALQKSLYMYSQALLQRLNSLSEDQVEEMAEISHEIIKIRILLRDFNA